MSEATKNGPGSGPIALARKAGAAQPRADAGMVSIDSSVNLAEPTAEAKKAQLKLLMVERENLALRLAELDHGIWSLEEFFRAGVCEEEPGRKPSPKDPFADTASY